MAMLEMLERKYIPKDLQYNGRIAQIAKNDALMDIASIPRRLTRVRAIGLLNRFIVYSLAYEYANEDALKPVRNSENGVKSNLINRLETVYAGMRNGNYRDVKAYVRAQGLLDISLEDQDQLVSLGFKRLFRKIPSRAEPAPKINYPWDEQKYIDKVKDAEEIEAELALMFGD